MYIYTFNQIKKNYTYTLIQDQNYIQTIVRKLYALTIKKKADIRARFNAGVIQSPFVTAFLIIKKLFKKKKSLLRVLHPFFFNKPKWNITLIRVVHPTQDVQRETLPKFTKLSHQCQEEKTPQ